MLYVILKFLHVLSITVWVGGVIMLLILNRLLSAAGDRTSAQALGRQGAVLGTRVFLPAVVVTLVTGIGMVQAGDLGWSAIWIIWGMAGLVASMLIGAVFTGAAARKLAASVAAGEIDAAGIARAQRKMFIFAVVNIVLLISIVFVMVVKPV